MRSLFLPVYTSDDRVVYLFTDAQCDTPTSCVMTQQNATFWVCGHGVGLVTPKFELGEIFVQCT